MMWLFCSNNFQNFSLGITITLAQVLEQNYFVFRTGRFSNSERNNYGLNCIEPKVLKQNIFKRESLKWWFKKEKKTFYSYKGYDNYG